MTWQAGAGAARTFTTPLPKSVPAPAYRSHIPVFDRGRACPPRDPRGCLGKWSPPRADRKSSRCLRCNGPRTATNYASRGQL